MSTHGSVRVKDSAYSVRPMLKETHILDIDDAHPADVLGREEPQAPWVHTLPEQHSGVDGHLMRIQPGPRQEGQPLAQIRSLEACAIIRVSVKLSCIWKNEPLVTHTAPQQPQKVVFSHKNAANIEELFNFMLE